MTRRAFTQADEIEKLLSEGLNLCVRARTLDSVARRESTLAASSNPDEWLSSGQFDRYIERNNIKNPHAPIHSKCGTLQLWIQDQYERDLLDWEKRAREALSKRGWSTP
jgi:hypothetical protein